MGGRLVEILRQPPRSRGCGRTGEQIQEAQTRAVSGGSTVARYSTPSILSMPFIHRFIRMAHPHLECISIQPLRKTRKRLEAGTSVGDESNGCDRPGNLSSCDFDTIGVAGLVVKGAYAAVSMRLDQCCAIRPYQKRALQDPWSVAATTDEQPVEPAGRWQCGRASSTSALSVVQRVRECQWAGEDRGELCVGPLVRQTELIGTG